MRKRNDLPHHIFIQNIHSNIHPKYLSQKHLQVLRCRSGDEKAKRAGEAEDAEAGGGEEEGGAGG